MNTEATKQTRVLLIRDDATSGLPLLIKNGVSRNKKSIFLDDLVVYEIRSEREEEIVNHLKKNEYDVVMPFFHFKAFDAIRAQHTGKVIGCGFSYFHFHRANYDGICIIDACGDIYKQFIESLEEISIL